VAPTFTSRSPCVPHCLDWEWSRRERGRQAPSLTSKRIPPVSIRSTYFPNCNRVTKFLSSGHYRRPIARRARWAEMTINRFLHSERGEPEPPIFGAQVTADPRWTFLGMSRHQSIGASEDLLVESKVHVSNRQTQYQSILRRAVNL